jgi:hypothetical protein
MHPLQATSARDRYSGSGVLAPGILGSFHLLDQRFGFLRSASGGPHQIRHNLSGRSGDHGQRLGCRCEGQGLRPFEHDTVVWLEQPNVGAGFGGRRDRRSAGVVWDFLRFWFPPRPRGDTAGNTASAIKWDRTTITGLTRPGISKRSERVQTSITKHPPPLRSPPGATLSQEPPGAVQQQPLRRSSERASREFCATCGSNLFWREDGADDIDVFSVHSTNRAGFRGRSMRPGPLLGCRGCPSSMACQRFRRADPHRAAPGAVPDIVGLSSHGAAAREKQRISPGFRRPPRCRTGADAPWYAHSAMSARPMSARPMSVPSMSETSGQPALQRMRRMPSWCAPFSAPS